MKVMPKALTAIRLVESDCSVSVESHGLVISFCHFMPITLVMMAKVEAIARWCED
jgi:hypothetical protein